MAAAKKTTRRQMKKKSSTKGKKRYTNKTLLVRPVRYERKWYQIGFNDIRIQSDQIYGINPFLLLTQGAASDQRIGLNLSNVKMYLTFLFTAKGTNNGVTQMKYQSAAGRCIVFGNSKSWHHAPVSTANLITAGVGDNILASDMFLDNVAQKRAYGYLNRDRNHILYDTGPVTSHINFPGNVAPDQIADGVAVCKKIAVNIGDIRYESNAQSYLRDNNVYIWLLASCFGFNLPGDDDRVGTIGLNMLVTYQDS